ncbi:MAG: CotH kinase family protein [Lachnospiraceae bacterium]|nr:CotH kinase family protein [Lachnospiraceae bacterium]
MKNKLTIIIAVVAILTVFCIVFSKMGTEVSTSVRTYQHEENKHVDTTVGITEIPEDGIVDNTFETHLPLVVLEADMDSIIDIYTVSEGDKPRDYADPNVTNPWVDMKISIYDSDTGVNKVTDEPALYSDGLIKLRGFSSRRYEKRQYGIKLLDETGAEREESILGMEADEDWVLGANTLDATYLRNYVAYNIGGQIFPYTPETRFCEVLVKNGDNYEYLGLFLFSETVKQSAGRVDIADFDENENRLSYIICRDRKDLTKTTLSTWASESQICYGWFSFKYPKEELLTDPVVSKIEDQISEIEKVLYSDDYETFLIYPEYINVDSFVDYFVVNEFFGNYDAGDNSTYYYQDSSHDFSMGPLWDYDGCWDNYVAEVSNEDCLVYPEQPWFEKLVQDPSFNALVVERYKELRRTIFSTEYVEEVIDETAAYLGNAVLRERSRWRATYEEQHLLDVVEDGRGYIIDRNRDTYEEEIIRVKDIMRAHAEWMDEYMDDYLANYVVEREAGYDVEAKSVAAVIFVVTFFIVIVLVNRKINGL